MQTLWFELDLDTLALKQIEISTWPSNMTSKQRMLEEALESVIAYNLPTLFPGEDLLLVQTQHGIVAMADIVAIDPLGFARLMELKAKPTRLDGDLWAQALAYGLRAIGESRTSWHRELGQALPRVPEDVALRAETLRVRRRAAAVGRKFLQEAGVELSKAYGSHNFFERQQVLISALRAQRGAPGAFDGASESVVRDTASRTYGVDVAHLDLERPATAVEQVLSAWGGRRDRGGAEITIVAPSVNTEANIAQVMEIEKRYVPFHLIDAELRWDENPPNPRVILSWAPGYRTTPSAHHRFAVSVRQELQRIRPAATDFDWNYVQSPRRRITWGHQTQIMAETNHEQDQVITHSEWLVDGIEDVRKQRDRAMAELATRLRPFGVESVGKELRAPWGRGDPSPASHLLAGYHEVIVSDLSYGEFDLFRRRILVIVATLVCLVLRLATFLSGGRHGDRVNSGNSSPAVV